MSIKKDLLVGKKILITDRVHQLLMDGLTAQNATVDYHPKMPYHEVAQVAKDYNGIIINSKVICDAPFLREHKHLEFIGRLGSGLDIIDLPVAAQLGIQIINSPDGNANAVSEHAMGMLLMLLNNLHRANTEVKNFEWNREANRGIEIREKTIGVIGVGHTGGRLVEKLMGWGATLLCYDKYRSDIETRYPYARQCEMSTIFEQADIISIHLPLTSETQGMIDDNWLSRCKKGTILINTARGGCVDTATLLKHLRTGHIGGACLDVLEQEKLDRLSPELKNVYSELFALPNVVLSPHIAGWTRESLVRIAQIILNKILRQYTE